jgi:hypothetical protein
VKRLFPITQLLSYQLLQQSCYLLLRSISEAMRSTKLKDNDLTPILPPRSGVQLFKG